MRPQTTASAFGTLPGKTLIVLGCLLTLQSMTGISAETTFTLLASFTGTNGLAPGSVPESRLLLACDGNFYGTTMSGGASNLGTVFRINPNGTFSVLTSLTALTGYEPQSGLIEGVDGQLYGTTGWGGANGAGTAFRMTTNGQLAAFAALDWTNGATPNGVIQVHDKTLYGTAWQGGTNGYGQFGTVFRLTTNGNLAAIYCFGTRTNADGVSLDGQGPQAPLVEASDGALYGTTTAGGTNGGFGTVFRITTNGSFTSLASLAGTNGANPVGALLEASDGSLVGTTSGGGIGFNGSAYSGNGTIFKVTKSGFLTTLHFFNGYPTDGAVPEFVELTPGTDGAWYGTTFYGGAGGSGMVFRMTRAGAVDIVYSFTREDQSGTNADGGMPWAGLIQAGNGNLYGVAGSGGAYGFGTVYCLSNAAFAQPFIQTISHTNTTTLLAWTPLPDRAYQLQYKSNFDDSAWMNVGLAVTETNRSAISIDSTAAGLSRIYRLHLLPQN
ncbi:MAG TPA: choice-of-anchor tandem repeat GloVer-containing protein [Verrucomicrobiae bacterium]|nr:choice-of-anchor tandem repeat GloVer-containing protein [Verrucomicrobiae bacterium]